MRSRRWHAAQNCCMYLSQLRKRARANHLRAIRRYTFHQTLPCFAAQLERFYLRNNDLQIEALGQSRSSRSSRFQVKCARTVGCEERKSLRKNKNFDKTNFLDTCVPHNFIQLGCAHNTRWVVKSFGKTMLCVAPQWLGWLHNLQDTKMRTNACFLTNFPSLTSTCIYFDACCRSASEEERPGRASMPQTVCLDSQRSRCIDNWKGRTIFPWPAAAINCKQRQRTDRIIWSALDDLLNTVRANCMAVQLKYNQHNGLIRRNLWQQRRMSAARRLKKGQNLAPI